MNTKDLRKLILQNPHVLLSRKSIKALLCDAFKSDMSIVNPLLFAFDEHIIDALRINAPLSPTDRARFTKILVQNYSTVNQRAKDAVDMWSDAFDPTLSATLTRIEKEQKEALLVETFDEKQEDEQREDPLDILQEADRLFEKKDDDQYFINPTISLQKNRIYVPCGVGNSDNGFFIYGINKTDDCQNPNANVYALVYNYLVRNTRINDDDVPKCIRDEERVYELDYRSVFRTTIVLLQLIKNNYCIKDTLVLNYRSDKDLLRTALRIIHFYAALFSRLIGIPHAPLQIKLAEKGVSFSLDGSNGVHVKDNTEFVSNARELWYGKKINYKLSRDNLNDLEYLLAEISPFDSFKEGQFEALCRMVSAKKHTVCIMPTGSGKSLIFYLISILQPLPICIVAPTDILIKDQIRNLKTFHRIDNVAHLQLTEENCFRCYEMFNSLNYITPDTLQNVYLFHAFRKINKGIITRHESMLKDYKLSTSPLFSYIVLDEIHCLSNWGHDFRPEYLMLSEKLNKYLDQIVFLGFTATANYTVVEDVQKQLSIPQENFISPIAFENNNITYEYVCVDNPKEMLSCTNKICQGTISRNERTIIFTKSDAVSRLVADAVGYEADVFTKEDPTAYYHFVENKCRILVASDELGVGINFPNIRNIIHFGLPLSKSEYVQEIGRAGRANELVHSYVVYLSSENAPKQLLRRDIKINDIPSIISELDNDYSDIYSRLTNDSPTSEILFQRILKCYRKFEQGHQVRYVESYKPNESVEARRILYMLYVVGYINDWYSFSKSSDSLGTDYSIDICSSDPESFRNNPGKLLQRMKNCTRDYFDALGDSRESVAKAGRATSPEEIIRIYVEWYYAKYLYHQNEQFMDLYEFIAGNKQSNDEITLSIKDYFMLPFIKLKGVEAQFADISFKEVGNKVLAGVSASLRSDVERVNSNRYSYKLDFFLFGVSLKYYGLFENSRYERIKRHASDAEWRSVNTFLERIYTHCDTRGRLAIVNHIDSSRDYTRGLTHFLGIVYKDEPKDLIYYGLIAKTINKVFINSRRKENV